MTEAGTALTLTNMPVYYREVLVLQEILQRAGFDVCDDLYFMFCEKSLAMGIHVHDPKTVKELQGEVYPVKAVDTPEGVPIASLMAGWAVAYDLWVDASPEARQILMDQSKVMRRANLIMVELAKYHLLPIHTTSRSCN